MDAIGSAQSKLEVTEDRTPEKIGAIDPGPIGEVLTVCRPDDSDFPLVQVLTSNEDAGAKSAAFEELVRRHDGVLHRVVSSFVPNEATVDEVVQETWIIVFKSISIFQGRSALKTWICRIAANRAKSAAIREYQLSSVEALANTADQTADDFLSNCDSTWGPQNPKLMTHAPAPKTPDQSLEVSEIMMCVRQAIEMLPEKQRKAIVFRDIGGLSTRETAEEMGISETHVRVSLFKARTYVRKVVSDVGYLREDLLLWLF